MPIIRRHFVAGVLGLVAAGTGGIGSARAESPEQILVDRARIVVETFANNADYASIVPYVRNAFGVVIVPGLLKGGLVIGGEYGRGVLLARDVESGLWSEPTFLDLYGGSFGIQIGGKSTDALFTVMNQPAVARILSARFKLGADASGALGPIGGGLGAATTARFGEDIYLFTRNVGLYGGLSLDGSYLRQRPDLNKAYYGRTITGDQLVLRRAITNAPGTQALREALARF